ncbi:MAG: hypothetical protein ACTIIQ_10890 [Corynebacterium variabile]|uniref:hypothetical protein n=1 Tax=Corynebacterium variabile TaxID=1727 RepID=UPI003F989B46
MARTTRRPTTPDHLHAPDHTETIRRLWELHRALSVRGVHPGLRVPTLRARAATDMLIAALEELQGTCPARAVDMDRELRSVSGDAAA